MGDERQIGGGHFVTLARHLCGHPASFLVSARHMQNDYLPV